jgi:hypothetical protein
MNGTTFRSTITFVSFDEYLQLGQLGQPERAASCKQARPR